MKTKALLAIALPILLSTQPIFAAGPSCDEYIRGPSDAQTQEEKATGVTRANLVSAATSALGFSDTVDISQYKGNTFLDIMRTVIKPKLDSYAKNGFTIVDKAAVFAALDKVSPKVRAQALKSVDKETLGKIADALQGQKVTLFNLPGKIADLKIAGADRYGLTTFFSLVSGGGVEIRLNSNTFADEVDYAKGDEPNAEQTGRGFGQGPNHLLDDASDKAYLQALQSVLMQSSPEETQALYTTLLQIIANCDTSGMAKLSPKSQTLLSDFLAIYVAEQDRHLMSDLRTHAWDISLLEVTLNAILQAGQSKMMVMYGGRLVDQFPKQAPGGQLSFDNLIPADLTAYWRFSVSSNPQFSKRSGINVARTDFLLQGKLVTKYMAEKFPVLVNNVERHFTGIILTGNVYDELNSYLISNKAPASITGVNDLVSDFVTFMMAVRANAQDITNEIVKNQPAAPTKN